VSHLARIAAALDRRCDDDQRTARARQDAGARRRAERTAVESALARRVGQTFHDEAATKGLPFEVVVPEDVPETTGRRACGTMLEKPGVERREIHAGGSVRLARHHEKRRTGITSRFGTPASGFRRSDAATVRGVLPAHDARSVEAVGTGLGLALVKETVDKHQGRIRVESEEGQGTVFVIQLPASKREADPGTHDGGHRCLA